MKKKINKKFILLSFLATVVAAGTCIFTYGKSKADNEADLATPSDAIVADASSDPILTSIDHIIQNSNTGDDKKYHVLEIDSGNPSSFGAVCANGGSGVLEKLVLNGYKNVAESFATGNIDFNSVSAFDTAGNPVDLSADIAKADLIYVSIDPDNPFTKTHDLHEETKIALETYAVQKFKPLFIDSFTKTSIIKKQTTTLMKDLAYREFANSGTSYSTYAWDKSLNAEQFMYSDPNSYFMALSGNKKYTNWTLTTVTNDSDATQKTNQRIAKTLVLNDGSDKTLTNKFLTNDTGSALATYSIPAGWSCADIDTSAHEYYTLDQTSMILKRGYRNRQDKPTLMAVDYMTLGTSSGSNVALNSVDFSSYDFVIIEGATSNADLGGGAYDSLINAMKGNTCIIYDSSLVAGSTITPDNDTSVNFAGLFDKVAYPTGEPRKENILVTTQNGMTIYGGAKNYKSVKDMADAINGGAFRSFKGNNSGDASTSIYTALEVEPCYPIDTALAVKLDAIKTEKITGNANNLSFQKSTGRGDGKGIEPFTTGSYYYLRTAGVLEKTSDEISYDGTRALSSYDSDYTGLQVTGLADNSAVVDYYAWHLSKAKVAHALGKTIDQVQVIHMSSVEFNTSKDTLLDKYDMIYLGGDNSAIKNSIDWKADHGHVYFKDGDTYTIGQSDVDKTLIGNDINDTRLKDLKDYAAKLPVVVEKSLVDAYGNGEVESATNMAALLGDLQKSSNCVWNFDNTDTIKIPNNDQEYGTTYGGYVTVFDGNEVADYKDLDTSDPTNGYHYYAPGTVITSGSVINEYSLSKMIQSNQRPKLNITYAPAIYNEASNNEITAADFKFTYSLVGATSATVKIMADDDSNGTFETDITGSITGNTVTAKSDALSASFSGPIYWKIIATVDGKSSSMEGLSKVTGKTKKVVNLLQIMPNISPSDRDNSKATLYLCTECQNARANLKTNGICTPTNTKYNHMAIEGLADGRAESHRIPSEYVTGTSGFNNKQAAAGYYVPQVTIKAQQNLSSWPYYIPAVTSGGYNVDARYEVTDSALINQIASWNSANSSRTHITYIKPTSNGTHRHKFGIVKYYNELAEIDQPSVIGRDDWNTNWFRDVQNDYDVETTILSLDEYRDLCTKVDSLYTGKTTTAEVDAVSKTYKDVSDEYGRYYRAMRSLINGTYTKTTDDPYADATDKSEFEKFMKNNFGWTANDFSSAVGASGYGTGYGSVVNNCDKYILDNINGLKNDPKVTSKNPSSVAEAEFRAEADKTVNGDERCYYDFFSMFSDQNQKYTFEFAPYYAKWRDACALEMYFREVWLTNLEYSSVYNEGSNIGKFNLKNVFNCIAVGAADNFNNEDMDANAAKTLKNYVDSKGSVIMFHDTLTSAGIGAAGAGTPNMTSILGESFGAMKTEWTQRSASYNEFDMRWDNGSKPLYKYATFDKYTELNQQTLHGSHKVADIMASADYCGTTDKATQSNDGIITMYPFQIGSRLQISPTTPQTYAANVNDSDKMTVYYCLSGGSTGSYSSLLAADPNDGYNNYFIYQYGNVYYAGAGHSLITGLQRNNNDERRLYINIILNSARDTVGGPDVFMFDASSTQDVSTPANNKFKNGTIKDPFSENIEYAKYGSKGGGAKKDAAGNYDYTLQVSDTSVIPEFSFYTTTSNTKIKSVEIWYDKDHPADATLPAYDASQGDVKVYSSTADHKDLLKYVKDDVSIPGMQLTGSKTSSGSTVYNTSIKLKDTYFTGNYAYICVQVTDDQNKSTVKTLRIEKVAELLDLN